MRQIAFHVEIRAIAGDVSDESVTMPPIVFLCISPRVVFHHRWQIRYSYFVQRNVGGMYCTQVDSCWSSHFKLNLARNHLCQFNPYHPFRPIHRHPSIFTFHEKSIVWLKERFTCQGKNQGSCWQTCHNLSQSKIKIRDSAWQRLFFNLFFLFFPLYF